MWFTVHLPRSAVAEYFRVDWETVGRCVSRTKDVIEPEISHRLDNLVNIGIDETSYKKGHKYITVIVNHGWYGSRSVTGNPCLKNSISSSPRNSGQAYRSSQETAQNGSQSASMSSRRTVFAAWISSMLYSGLWIRLMKSDESLGGKPIHR